MTFAEIGLPDREERAIFAVTLPAVKPLPCRIGNIRRIETPAVSEWHQLFHSNALIQASSIKPASIIARRSSLADLRWIRPSS